MKKHVVIISFMLFAFSQASYAIDNSNLSFYDRCKPELPVHANHYCLEPMEVVTSLADARGKSGQICFTDENVPLDKYLVAYLSWVEGHPEKSNENYFKGIHEALQEKYPCIQDN